MIQGWLVSFVINFALRQLSKFHDQTDWIKLKRDLDVRIRDACPGAWFDEEAVAVIDWTIDTLSKTMVDNTLSAVIANILSGNYPAATRTAKTLLLGAADKEYLDSRGARGLKDLVGIIHLCFSPSINNSEKKNARKSQKEEVQEVVREARRQEEEKSRVGRKANAGCVQPDR